MILGLAAQQARFGRRHRRYYDDSYDDDGPPLWSLCFLAVSAVVAVCYSGVLFGEYWRGDRETAVRAYRSAVRNWTLYRDELLHTNFSARASWDLPAITGAFSRAN